MTTNDQIRLAALEIYYAEGEITQRELAELEALRDKAGQGWLLDPGPQEPAQEPVSDHGAELPADSPSPSMATTGVSRPISSARDCSCEPTGASTAPPQTPPLPQASFRDNPETRNRVA